jgi:hypothetical protein
MTTLQKLKQMDEECRKTLVDCINEENRARHERMIAWERRMEVRMLIHSEQRRLERKKKK